MKDITGKSSYKNRIKTIMAEKNQGREKQDKDKKDTVSKKEKMTADASNIESKSGTTKKTTDKKERVDDPPDIVKQVLLLEEGRRRPMGDDQINEPPPGPDHDDDDIDLSDILPQKE